MVLKSLMIYLQALYFNRVCSSVGLFHYHTMLPATVFIVCASYLSVFFSFHFLLVGFFFFLVAFGQLLDVKRADERFAENLFFATFSLSIASLFFIGYSYFLLWVWLLLPTIGALTMRHFFLSLVGFLLPYFFIGMYFFLIDSFHEYFQWLQLILPEFRFFETDFHNALWIPIIFFLLGWLSYWGSGQKILQETKAGFTIFQVALLPGLLQFFLPIESLELGFYLFLPGFAVFINYYFFVKSESFGRNLAFLGYLIVAFLLPWALWLQNILRDLIEGFRFF